MRDWPMRRPKSEMRAPDAGFTLLEALVVLVIVGLTISVALATGRSKEPNLQMLSTQLTTELNFARVSAISKNRSVAMVVDPNTRSLRSNLSPSGMRLPEAVRMTFLPMEGIGRADHSSRLVFFADGSSTGGAFKLSEGPRAVVVRVDWLSGAVTQESVHR
jgi:general secretion pathway protein H